MFLVMQAAMPQQPGAASPLPADQTATPQTAQDAFLPSTAQADAVLEQMQAGEVTKHKVPVDDIAGMLDSLLLQPHTAGANVHVCISATD